MHKGAVCSVQYSVCSVQKGAVCNVLCAVCSDRGIFSLGPLHPLDGRPKPSLCFTLISPILGQLKFHTLIIKAKTQENAKGKKETVIRCT